MTTIIEAAVLSDTPETADTVTLNINLDATYKLNGTPIDKLTETVEGNVRAALDNGLLTNDLPGPATVDSWELEVGPTYEETPDTFPDDEAPDSQL